MADTGFVIPDLDTIIDRVKGELNSRMGNQNAFIRRALAWALAHAIAGAVWGLYLYQKWISRQTIIDTAEAAQMARWARIFNILRNPADEADGTVEVTGVAGSTVSDDELLQRDDGETYKVINGPYNWAVTDLKDVDVEATEAGDDGNWDTGNTLEFVSPPAGVVATATVKSPGIAGGVDEETDASLLERLLDRIQDPPQGGSDADYELWAKATPGVNVGRVWPFGYPDKLVGYVDVFFIVDPTTSPADTTVIPSAGEVSLVDAYIRDRTRKPSGMSLNLIGATPTLGLTSDAMQIAITVTLDDGFALADVKDNIQVEIEAKFREFAEVVLTGTATIANSHLLDAIGDAAGVATYDVTDINGDGTGDSDIEFAALKYPTVVQGVGAGKLEITT